MNFFKIDTSFLRKFFIGIVVCLGGGWLNGYLAKPSLTEWYIDLLKPYGNPPAVVFPIVWSILYVAMALAFTLLWVSHTPKKKIAVVSFFIQLGFNEIFLAAYPLWYVVAAPLSRLGGVCPLSKSVYMDL